MRCSCATRNGLKDRIASDDRAEKYNQRSALIIVTGEKGAGRKTLAGMLEEQLFRDGKLVYYLGVGSVLYGVNATLSAVTGTTGMSTCAASVRLRISFSTPADIDPDCD